MKVLWVCFFFMLSFLNLVVASEPVIEWDNHYFEGQARDVLVGPSGNIYVVGNTGSEGWIDSDFLILKINSEGEVIWNVTSGNSTYSDYFYSLDIDNEENIYVLGIDEGASPVGGYKIFKYNKDGQHIFNRSIDLEIVVFSGSVALDSSGDLNVLIPLGRDYYYFRYSPSGDLITQKNISFIGEGLASGIEVDYDGNIYVGGETEAILSKVDREGNIIWNNSISDKPFLTAIDVSLGEAESVYLLSYIDDRSKGQGELISKYDSAGNIIWNLSFFNDSYSNVLVSNVVYDRINRKIYSSGSITVRPRKYFHWVKEFDHYGNLNWIKTIPSMSRPSYHSSAGSGGIALGNDGSIYFAREGRNETNLRPSFRVTKLMRSLDYVEIFECGVINQPGNYILRNDLLMDDKYSHKCIDIRSDNVFLDCDGRNVYVGRSRNYAIYSNGNDNNMIQNCNINSSKGTGVQLRYSKRSTVFNNNISAGISAIRVERSMGVIVLDNKILSKSVGIFAYRLLRGTFVDNEIYSESIGIQLIRSRFNKFMGNIINSEIEFADSRGKENVLF